MLGRKIDRGLDAILDCMVSVPDLRDCYTEAAPERAALDNLMVALKQVDAVLFKRNPKAPQAR